MLLQLPRWITTALAPLTVICAVTAYYEPSVFSFFAPVLKWLFAATMFALGLVLQPEELRVTLRRPGQIGLGVLTQYTVMPLLGFAVAMLGGLDPAVAIGFIIVAAAPGAMASNVIVYLAGGAVAFSIAMTTVATIASPLVTPLLVKVLGGALMEVSFLAQMKTILMTVIAPLGLGMIVRLMLEREQRTMPEWVREWAPALASSAIIIICATIVAVNQERIEQIGVQVMALVIILNALGYLLGWQLARLYGFDYSRRLTLSIEIGMQNAGLGVVLALTHFSPEAALPGAMFAAWSVITSALLTAWLRRKRRQVEGVA
jgi:BASS family bile acid:Na+ symporter